MNSILIYRADNYRISLYSSFTQDIYDKYADSSNFIIAMSNRDSLADAKEKISAADCVIVFANGAEDEINHKLNDNGTGTVLINIDDTSLFDYKKIVVFSCFTLANLGIRCTDNETLAYAGFRSNIEREIRTDNEKKISDMYSIIFKESIDMALMLNFTFVQFKKFLLRTTKAYKGKLLINNKELSLTKMFDELYNVINITINTFDFEGDGNQRFY